MFKVSYLHLQGYRVSRTFDTREAAQEFIDVNAMVHPLPGAKFYCACGCSRWVSGAEATSCDCGL